MKKYIRLEIFLCFFALFLIGMSIMRYSITTLENISNGYGILDLNIGWNKESISNHFTALGTAGRSYYQTRFLLIDLVYPLLYSTFYASCIAYLQKLLKLRKRGFHYLFLLPFLGALFDWLENLCIFILLQSFPNLDAGLVYLFIIFNLLKFIFVYISLLLILLMIVSYFYKRLKYATSL